MSSLGLGQYFSMLVLFGENSHFSLKEQQYTSEKKNHQGGKSIGILLFLAPVFTPICYGEDRKIDT